MPNPTGTTSTAVVHQGRATYDILLISTETGRVRAILAEKMESSHSLATTKAWDDQAGTKMAIIVDCLHGKHKVGDVFKDFVKGFGYFTPNGIVQNNPSWTPLTATPAKKPLKDGP